MARQDSIPDKGGVPVMGKNVSLGAESGGALTGRCRRNLLARQLRDCDSQGYRTEEEETQDIPISMVHLGWLNVELKSDDWVKDNGSALRCEL